MDLTEYEKLLNNRGRGRVAKDIITVNKTGWIGFGKGITNYHPTIKYSRVDIYVKKIDIGIFELVFKFGLEGQYKVSNADSIGISCKALPIKHLGICGTYEISGAQQEGEELYLICQKKF